jgi:hypothetical protein
MGITAYAALAQRSPVLIRPHIHRRNYMPSKKVRKDTPNTTTAPDSRQKLSRKIQLGWIPKRFADMVQRAYNRAGPSGRDNAIKCKCYECCGYDGGCTEDVRNCADATCPLWAFRPGATVKK